MNLEGKLVLVDAAWTAVVDGGMPYVVALDMVGDELGRDGLDNAMWDGAVRLLQRHGCSILRVFPIQLIFHYLEDPLTQRLRSIAEVSPLIRAIFVDEIVEWLKLAKQCADAMGVPKDDVLRRIRLILEGASKC